jgi:hypothetical protein
VRPQLPQVARARPDHERRHPAVHDPLAQSLRTDGPIYPERFAEKTVRKAIAETPLSKELEDQQPAFAVVTNSTYDGLCYKVDRVLSQLGPWVDRVHFDEAWFGYARFNPLYAGRMAMRGDPLRTIRTGPTVFCTHSTHKLLAAFSQASYIHVRDGRNAIPASALQRNVHAARLDLAVLSDHRVQRDGRHDDGRCERRGADARIDRRGDPFPATGRQAASPAAAKTIGSSARGMPTRCTTRPRASA